MKPQLWTRREILFVAAGTAVSPGARSLAASVPALRSLARVEAHVGGRVGVFALDTGTGRELAHRPDERFAMCSTFKWALVAAVLARADSAQIPLDDRIAYGPADLLEYAPVARQHVDQGSMTLDALMRAAVTLSDNTAANLLLAKMGGPAGFTAFVRSLGDRVTRLDRNEPTLNNNDAGDPRDTTSPRAMVGLMRQILCGDVLSTQNRDRLLGWLRDCETGKERLRAGLPERWSVGDKTGTGQHGAVNDVAIAIPPGRAPILIASYLSRGHAEVSALSAAHAIIGRLVAREFGRDAREHLHPNHEG